ncbi:MnhB domain-containing protein [Streptoalloteichus hindustanus]|uniref:Multisubunit sodium/proton antiporter, MrpB subunit n=1 Tax=Streptoalloteichus hindustanus TaxID=2017 RepID=A0A1M5P6L7_STRHI|nr:MnhB domain-containing protein [Streptoalloteichus hindustanus]SHG97426.1 multisubunit sodium/proton antiporter, MrpB subunit [Streptoalloteichus hindustanus]
MSADRPGPDTPPRPRGKHQPRDRWLPGAHELPVPRRSMLLEVVTRLVFPAVLVLSLYLLLAGHHRTGGGFSGGLVASQAFVLRYLAGGRADLARAAPAEPQKVLGVGLALAAAVALTPLLLGQPVLTSAVLHVEPPVFGPVEVPSSLLFDAGVYLVVVGVTLKLLRSLGVRIERETDNGGEAR